MRTADSCAHAAVLADAAIFAFRTAFIGGLLTAANGAVSPPVKPSSAAGRPEARNSIIAAANRALVAQPISSGGIRSKFFSAKFPGDLLRFTKVEPVGQHLKIAMPKLCVEFSDPLRLVERQGQHANDPLIVNWRNRSRP